ncbi:uncharacterized protein LOC119576600 [Penaeus monodon]|uniref:uncharacterized protein LOC119576600 n=1 Tax=Penaeus monodon TaxID=6687 RepID=UPI0018A72070|nr:uncharacterized protein LOC119576600 [Penaeus monodon]
MELFAPRCVASVAIAAPQYSYGASRAASSEEVEFVPILKDDRWNLQLRLRSCQRISFSQSGSPDGDEDIVIKAGEYSFTTAPDDTEIHLTFAEEDRNRSNGSDEVCS